MESRPYTLRYVGPHGKNCFSDHATEKEALKTARWIRDNKRGSPQEIKCNGAVVRKASEVLAYLVYPEDAPKPMPDNIEALYAF